MAGRTRVIASCARPWIGTWSTYTVLGLVGYVVASIVLAILGVAIGATLAERAIAIMAPAVGFVVAVYAARAVVGVERIVFYQAAGAAWLAAVTFASIADLRVGLVSDLAIILVATFLAFGRVGCFHVACCHGRPSSWGVRYSDVSRSVSHRSGAAERSLRSSSSRRLSALRLRSCAWWSCSIARTGPRPSCSWSGTAWRASRSSCFVAISVAHTHLDSARRSDQHRSGGGRVAPLDRRGLRGMRARYVRRYRCISRPRAVPPIAPATSPRRTGSRPAHVLWRARSDIGGTRGLGPPTRQPTARCRLVAFRTHARPRRGSRRRSVRELRDRGGLRARPLPRHHVHGRSEDNCE